MASPYPGMDPYLEDPFRWPGFHSLLAGEIMAALNRQLVPDYYANVEERVYISDETDIGRKTIIPDVRILATGRKPRGGRVKPAQSAVALVCEPVEVTTLFDDETHERRLEIRTRVAAQGSGLADSLAKPAARGRHSPAETGCRCAARFAEGAGNGLRPRCLRPETRLYKAALSRTSAGSGTMVEQDAQTEEAPLNVTQPRPSIPISA